MSDPGQDGRDLRDMIDRLLADLDAKNRDALDKFLDLEKSLVKEHQRFVFTELSNDNETLKNFARLLMASWTQVLAFQRDHRERVRDIYGALTDGHLKFIELLQSHLKKEPRPRPRGKAPKQGKASAGDD
jgi:hypothetical protein